MNVVAPMSVGLGGDGDELFAIRDVETAFSVKIDKADAQNWHTAGDLFLSLQNALPADIRADVDTWTRFTEALSCQTGVDPEAIERDSPLLSQSQFWIQAANASAVFWIAVAASILALVVWAIL